MKREERMYRFAAAAIEMGDPKDAGKGIAEIIKFLTKRVSPENRQKSLLKLREKIINLNEHEIALKKTPPTSTLGQSISFVKNVLIGHDPDYIRTVLNHIYVNLG